MLRAQEISVSSNLRFPCVIVAFLRIPSEVELKDRNLGKEFRIVLDQDEYDRALEFFKGRADVQTINIYQFAQVLSRSVVWK